jgi:hypothetical protein
MAFPGFDPTAFIKIQIEDYFAEYVFEKLSRFRSKSNHGNGWQWISSN